MNLKNYFNLFIWRLLLATLVLSLSTLSYAEDEVDKYAKPKAAALKWLNDFNNKEYVKCWKNSSSLIHNTLTEKNFIQTFSGVRKNFGKVKSRKLVNLYPANTLPGAPDGHYVVFIFETTFEHKQHAIESMTTVFEDDRWWVAGYYVK